MGIWNTWWNVNSTFETIRLALLKDEVKFMNPQIIHKQGYYHKQNKFDIFDKGNNPQLSNITTTIPKFLAESLERQNS